LRTVQAVTLTPYSINCNDNKPGYSSEVSSLCSSSNFQIAGYQAAARSGNYLEIYKKFYSDNELPTVLNRVIANSSKSIRNSWSYNDPGQQKGLVSKYKSQTNSATTSKISPNANFFSEEGQFYTLVLGKDPNMVVGLNSYAVSERDLISALRNTSQCGYGYICTAERQLISNMIMALYLFNGGNITSYYENTPTTGRVTTDIHADRRKSFTI
jgi:hypothetical protein